MKAYPKRITCLFLVCILLAALSPALADRDFDERVWKAFSKRQVTSGCVLISLNGEVIYSYSRGPKDIRGGEWTVDTVQRVASVSKFVTAVGLMTLWEKHAIELDYNVMSYLPFPVYNPFFPDTPITPRQILSHTSSFRNDINFVHPEWEKISVKRNNYYDEHVRPGEAYAYSNMNGALLGALIEACSGQSVNTYMKENVFRPLGIDAAYHPALLDDTSQVGDMLESDGSVFISGQAQLKRLNEYDDTCDPRSRMDVTVGQLYISASDLLTLLNTLLNDGTAPNGYPLLSPATVALMETDQSTLPHSGVTASGEYGLGMQRCTDIPGGMWYGHQGRVSGYSCDAFYQPDTGLAIVVIGNGYRVLRHDSIVVLAHELMEMAAELVP